MPNFLLESERASEIFLNHRLSIIKKRDSAHSGVEIPLHFFFDGLMHFISIVYNGDFFFAS
jgi:hypothetical protein